MADNKDIEKHGAFPAPLREPVAPCSIFVPMDYSSMERKRRDWFSKLYATLCGPDLLL